MKPLERYLQAVRRDLFGSPEEHDRLESDLRAHFAEAEARGEPAGRILEELGPPAEVAAAFNAGRPIRYAGFWPRLVAFIGDCGLLLALAIPALATALLLQTRAAGGSAAATAALAAAGLAVAGIFTFYFPLLEARFGKTLGKHLLRLRVVRESGAPIGLGQAFVRRLSLFFELLVVDALFIPFTDRRQRALDVIAKTVVAHEPGPAASWRGYAACLLLPVAAVLLVLAALSLCAPA